MPPPPEPPALTGPRQVVRVGALLTLLAVALLSLLTHHLAGHRVGIDDHSTWGPWHSLADDDRSAWPSVLLVLTAIAALGVAVRRPPWGVLAALAGLVAAAAGLGSSLGHLFDPVQRSPVGELRGALVLVLLAASALVLVLEPLVMLAERRHRARLAAAPLPVARVLR